MLFFSNSNILFKHDSGGHRSSLQCACVLGVGGGHKKRDCQTLVKIETREYYLFRRKQHAVLSLAGIHKQYYWSCPLLFHYCDASWHEVPPPIQCWGSPPGPSLQTPQSFLKSSFPPDSQVQFWMWPAASKNKVILLGLSSEGRGCSSTKYAGVWACMRSLRAVLD